MRILLTGASGQVGGELAKLLPAHGEVIAVDRAALDLANPDAIVAVMRETAPDVVVNAAAYTAVDLAEREREAAFAVNGRAPRVFAEEARRAGAVLVHYSTDYVFDGRATAPYDESSAPGPLNVYGESKLEGERAIAASGAAALVLRTSWVYGLTGRNFFLTIRRLARERDELRIVADQTGTPNWSRDLAQATARLVALGRDGLGERAGLYHFSSTGSTTWHGFARAIVGGMTAPTLAADAASLPPEGAQFSLGSGPSRSSAKPLVTPIATSEYPTPARRPAYGVLATGKFARTFGFRLPAWQDGLAGCLRAEAMPE